MLGDLLMLFFEVVCQGSVIFVVKYLCLLQLIVIGCICQLEEMYGVELFYCCGSWLDLFDFGVSFMFIVECLVQQEGDVDFFLCNVGDLCIGNLCVGVMGLYYILFSVVVFCVWYLIIEIIIEFGNLQQMFEVLLEVCIDLVVLFYVVDDECLYCIMLVEDMMVLVVLLDYVFVWCLNIMLDDIVGCQLLMCELGFVICCVIEDVFVKVGIELVSMSIIGSCEVIYEVISLGLGCSIVFVCEVLCWFDVCVLLFVGNVLVIYEYLYFLKECKDVWLVCVFFDCVDLWFVQVFNKKVDVFIVKVMVMDIVVMCQGCNFVVF